jgi:hemolysin type calcium-binding protein
MARTHRLALALCAGALAAAAVPSAASASGVFLQGGTLHVVGFAGETNHILVTKTQINNFRVVDGGAAIGTLGAGCRSDGSPNAAACSGEQIGATGKVDVETNDGDDTIDARPAGVPALILGGDGNDTLTGGAGDDLLVGGEGNDVMDGQGGADIFAGQNGTDRADYVSRTGPVTVSLDGQANDGAAGERDNVLDDVETIRGGSGNDSLTGNGNRNFLIGGPGDDFIFGLGGAHDDLNGGPGDDHLFAVDGLSDDVSCGDGADQAQVDLQDVFRVGVCEFVSRLPKDEPPTVAIGHSALRFGSDGGVSVRLSCPRNGHGCAGTLTLRQAGHTVGHAAYRLAHGHGAAIRVATHGARTGEVTAVAAEHDAQGRPRTTTARLTLRDK